MEPVRTIRLTSFERLHEEANEREPWEPQRPARAPLWRCRRPPRRVGPRRRFKLGVRHEVGSGEQVEAEESGERYEEQVELEAVAPEHEIIAMNIQQHKQASSRDGGGSGNNSEFSFKRRIRLAVLMSLLVLSSQLTTSHCDHTSQANVRHRNNHLQAAAASTAGSQSNAPHRRSLVGLEAGATKAANSSKVMALATKLEHWLQCHRANLLAAYKRQMGDSSQQPNELQRPAQQHAQVPPGGQPDQNGTSGATEPQVATCAAHFDGRLCWPEARAGQEVLLACPQINSLYSPGSIAATNHQEELEQHQPVRTVIANNNIQSDINQTQEITTTTSSQSIRPIGTRATSINQSEAISQQLGDSGSNTIGSKPARDSGPRAGFARRTCEPQLASAKWQPAANYADCGHLLDRWPADYNQDGKHGDDDDDNGDRQLFESLAQQLERIDPRIDPYSEALDQWIYCIGQIIEERERLASGQPSGSLAPTNTNSSAGNKASAGECPIIFDGWRCWPATEAGGTAYLNCPMRPGFSAKRKAFKICTKQADWARHPDSNRYWSNYTTCVDTVDLAFRTKIININVIGYLMSLVALTVSLMIFVVFKNLRCTRVTIHKNLFVSFIVNNSMWIVWNTYIISKPQVLESNPLGCRLWHVLVHYFLMSNYFWMFCEGLYLHTLLVVTFIKEDKILKWFYLLGWLTPIPIIVAYAYERSSDENYAKFCWIDQSPHDVIFQAPIVTSLVLNLVFLINIVRVLVMKLRANNAQDTHQTRKAARATLILIPLLGLNYILTPFRPEPESEWHVYYEVVAAVCTSLQGLCVAILFCFYNGEVTNTIKKRLKDSFLFNRDNKRTMRSRSNTAMSNIFNNNNNNNNNNNDTQAGQSRCAPDFRPQLPQASAASSSSWSSSSGANLVGQSQLQRRQQMAAANNHKPNGRQNTSDKLTDASRPADGLPALARPPDQQLVIETKLVATLKQQTPPAIDEEAVNLLAPSESNNNNNN